MKFDFSKKSGETKKKTKKYVKPSINSPVLNKITSLPSETKTITSDLKPNAAIEEDEKMQESFRKHYVKNIAEAIGDPKDIQFTLKQYWNNLPTAEEEHFSQSSPSIRVNEAFCFCKIRKHEKSKMGPLFTCDICHNWYRSSYVKIDEDYLKYMPVFTCPKCFKESFFTFSSYAFKKYIESRELDLANV